MPTVHLSLPDKVYRELKKKAAELGIQVTDLIKIYINQGLEHGIIGPRNGERKSSLIEERELEKRAEEAYRVATATKLYVQGKIRELEAMISFLLERFDQLEEVVVDIKKELKQREYVAAASD